MMRLYEATAQLDTVSGWIEEHADEILANGGALPPELEELLNQAEGDFAQKAEAVALMVREKRAYAAAVKIEADRLSQRAKTASNAADSLEEYLHRQMTASGLTKVEGKLVTVSLQKNPPSVKVTREPFAHTDGDQFVTEIPARLEWDKAAIKAAAKAGDPLPDGVSVVQSMGLRIR